MFRCGLFTGRHLLCLLCVLCAMGGCSSGFDAVRHTAQQALGKDATPSDAQLNPRFSYLRVTVDDRPAFLALGNLERSADGTVQVWYSARKQVLKFQNGRLVGAVGTTTEWRNVKLVNAPRWNEIERDTNARWLRVRDVLPGYRYNVEDRLEVRRIDAPPISQLRRVDPRKLSWFEERQSSEVADMRLPVARYAVDSNDGHEEVIYGEQCLSMDFCFTWQLWPLSGQK